MPARKSAAPAKKSETKIVRRRVKKEEVAAAAPAPAEPAPVVEAAANEPAAEEESVVSRFTATIDALQNTLTEMRSA